MVKSRVCEIVSSRPELPHCGWALRYLVRPPSIYHTACPLWQALTSRLPRVARLLFLMSSSHRGSRRPAPNYLSEWRSQRRLCEACELVWRYRYVCAVVGNYTGKVRPHTCLSSNVNRTSCNELLCVPLQRNSFTADGTLINILWSEVSSRLGLNEPSPGCTLID